MRFRFLGLCVAILMSLPVATAWAQDGFKITSEDEAFQLKVSGRLQFDGRFALGEDDPATSTWRMRRIRITTSGRVFTYYEYVVQVDFSGRGATLQDGWIDVSYWDAAKFRLGNQKQPFGLETLQSDNWVRFVERSMISNFVAPSYDVGAMVFGRLFNKRVGYRLGLYNGNGLNTLDANSDKDFAGRLVLRPFAPSDNLWTKGIQLAGALTIGNQSLTALDGTGPRTMVGAPVFSYATGVTTRGARTRVELSLAWHAGPLAVMTEYLSQEQKLTEAAAGEQRVKTTGWYLQVAYALTGEQQSFGGLSPTKAFDPKGGEGGGAGAVELAFRVGRVDGEPDLQDYIAGSRSATQIAFGVNWYPVKNIKITPNYQHAEFGNGDAEDSILVRAQLVY